MKFYRFNAARNFSVEVRQEGDIAVGDTVAEMHLHDTNFGLLQGWNVGKLFEIEESMYEAIRSQFDSTKNENRGIANKYAQAVSVHVDISGGFDAIDEVIVIYVYDDRYWMTTLSLPPEA